MFSVSLILAVGDPCYFRWSYVLKYVCVHFLSFSYIKECCAASIKWRPKTNISEVKLTVTYEVNNIIILQYLYPLCNFYSLS